MQGDVPADIAAAIAGWPVELRAAVAQLLAADPRVNDLLTAAPEGASATSPDPVQDTFRMRLNLAETEEDVAGALLRRWSGAIELDAVSLGMLDPDDGTLRVLFVGDIPGEYRDRYYAIGADGPGPMAEVARTGESMVFEDTGHSAERHRSVLQDFNSVVRALIFHPLRDSAGVLIGAVGLGWFQPRRIPQAQVEATAQSVSLAGPALARIRGVQRERRIAVDLQEHLLDLNRTSTAAAVAAAYQPAAEAMRVGGDWYLVAPADEPERIAFCVGDVVGLGLPAATVMTRLRSAISAASRTLTDPVAVLDLVERYARTLRGAHCATVAYGMLDPATHTLRYMCAGHPYPLLIDPDGRPHYLMEGRRPPLSALAEPSLEPCGTAMMPPGSMLILYTDGLIERRGEDLDDGLARLARAAAECAGLPTGSVCAELLRRMAPPGGYTDDVALLAVRPVGTTPTSYVRVLPAELEAVGSVRRELRDWLATVCADPATEHDVLVSLGEALTNAVEHGSDPYPGSTVSLEVVSGADGILATVGDGGHWSQDSSASHRQMVRGRGLKLIHALSTHVETQRTTHGTRVTLHYGCKCESGGGA
jgi:anti-sigma regulatory factor (Ser/Thr protein kinase)